MKKEYTQEDINRAKSDGVNSERHRIHAILGYIADVHDNWEATGDYKKYFEEVETFRRSLAQWFW